MVTRSRESGAVSLFLVIFAMLLITVVTLSFLRVMLKDETASSVSDLSQSAYDSALAGTEDAKRALIYYRTLCNNGDPNCSTVRDTINSTECNQGLKDIVTTAPNQEVLIQQSSSAADPNLNLNQAYTCVKIALDTKDYVGTIEANTSKLIPLRTTKDFNSVTIEWYNSTDLGSAASPNVSLVADSAARPLYLQSQWPVNRPSLLRTQLIQFGDNFTLTDFDNSDSVNSNTNTLFLYPTGPSGAQRPATNSIDFTKDVRKTAPATPRQALCSGKLSSGGWACTVTLNLPEAIGQTNDDRTAYLRLTPLYNRTHFRVSFSNDALFKGVQPTIDSTGRANSQYRRIEARVDLVNTNFVFPEAAVDVSGDLCKDFIVTANTADYVNSCTP